MTNLDLMDQELPLQHGPCQGPPPRPPSSSSGSQNVALSGCDVSYQTDLWSPEEDHIWGALDEGCNSTCHSKAWGELAEDRLRHFGLTFPWIDGSTKSFAGLGSSTKTLGKRNLPFCIQVGDYMATVPTGTANVIHGTSRVGEVLTQGTLLR